jgi:hypothetical protein
MGERKKSLSALHNFGNAAPHHNMFFADNGVLALWGIPSSRIQRLGSEREMSQGDSAVQHSPLPQGKVKN